MTTILTPARVEHVYPYADKADQPVMVWDITLSTPQGTITLSFGTPRLLAVSPGEWMDLRLEETDGRVCVPDLCERGPDDDHALAVHAA